MERVTVSGTKNGSNTAFSIAAGDLSVSPAITFLVFNGQILQLVTATPQVGQATLSTAGAIVVGLAPLAADTLYAFTTDAVTKGLTLATLTGVINGTNVTYTLASAPPAGSNVILLRNGVVQDQVVAAPSVGQFSISGTTLTLGTAPTSGEILAAWIEQTVTVPMRAISVLSQVGSLVSLNFQVVAGSTFSLFVLYNGIVLQRVTVAPLTGQYRALLQGQQLQLGLAPVASDVILVYLVNVEGQAEPLPPVVRHFPSYFQLQNELLVMMHERIDLDEAKMCLNRSWQNMLEGWSWSVVKTDGVILTSVPQTAGTIAVTQGLATATGTGTTLTASDEGGVLTLGTHAYLLTDVQISGSQQILTLDTPYTEASNAALTYTYRRHIYALDPDVVYILSMTGAHWRLDEQTQSVRMSVDPDLRIPGEPTHFARRGFNTQSIYEVELYPIPNARYRIRYVAVRRTALSTLGQSVPELGQAILELAAEMACGIVASKRAAERDYPGAGFWQRKGQLHLAAHLDSLQDMKRMDRKRFGHTTSTSVSFGEDTQRDVELFQ